MMKLRFDRLWIIGLFVLLAVAVRGEVKEVFVKPSTVAVGEPIKPPLRILPPVLPDPPTPEEIEQARKEAIARAQLAAAKEAYFARVGITNTMDAASISNAIEKISGIAVVKTNDVSASTNATEKIVTTVTEE